MGQGFSVDLSKGRYFVAPIAAAALLGMACSSNNSNNGNKNNSAATQAAATRAATTASQAVASPAAFRPAGSPAAGSPAAAHPASPAAGSPAAGAVTTTSPAADLRVTLDRLLSEHADLAMVAMQKGFSGAPDFMPVAAQLDKNTTDLSKAVASVYGDAAGTKFQELWKAHIGMFVDFTVGTATKDSAKRDKALADLANYRKDFAAFLNGANPNLPADAVSGLLQTHVNELTGTLDAYAAKDYAKTYQLFDEADQHMFMTGDALAAGIVKQSPAKFAATLVPGDSVATVLAVTENATYAYNCTIVLGLGDGLGSGVTA